MELNYGAKIKELRELENITQEKMAEVLGIKRSSYNQFEQQYDIIPIKRLVQVASFFDVSVDYLFTLTAIKNYPDNKKEINFSVSSKRLKEFRKENKLTQVKLASDLKASEFVILHHEQERTVLATPFLYTICKKYNISADYLLGKVDKPKYLK